ncbi:DNA mismatch repair protein MutS [Candidatus Gracilibacteria bacterium]|nr:DNA mismatch repair protein MutS [Candidatus Gracilibacteria bacterium]
MNDKKVTPMMEQYLKVKKEYPDTFVFFRLGDFYEMFFDDAVEASRLLQITLTARNKGENKAPMCGVPYHAANSYIARLTRLGKKVAICEQLSDPNLPGLVQRDVIRVITPGTTFDENVLEQKRSNYVMSVVKRDDVLSLAYADITTGEFMTADVSNGKDLQAEIERIAPAEMIVSAEFMESDLGKSLKNRNSRIFFSIAKEAINDASFLVMDYLKQTQKSELKHFDRAQTYHVEDFMPLDEATLKNLELLQTLAENKREGSLLWVLDKTVTSMGGRMMRFFVTHPLVNRQEIEKRLTAVESFAKRQDVLMNLTEVLKDILDLERIMGRLSLGHASARDLIGLKNSLRKIPVFQSMLAGIGEGPEHTTALIGQIENGLDGMEEICGLIEKAIVPDPPLATNEGGMIADGYNAELDELKSISRQGKSFIQGLQKKEIERTGINTLKIGYNSVFGYYIEISKGAAKNAPADYIRKQTLVNAERFITPELKEYEEKVLGAEEKIIALEQRLFNEIRGRILEEVKKIQQTARNIALLDVLCSLAKVALENDFCKPEISVNSIIQIVEGRHPVVEKMSSNGRFVPNDCYLNRGNGANFLLITGPNMGGKSTYLRQIALITLMAHLGSFVPAQKAVIGLTDRIFTRVGASDNLVKGQSTFMVEMKEAANILASATDKSLIILDEIGRGTSTYDGMSIAWSIMEFIHDGIKANTLFATHYHELISLGEKLAHAANYSVAVKEENEDGIVFLYKIIKGGINRSYGIAVAKLAGLPQEVVGRARQILNDLEEGVMETAINKQLTENGRVNENQQLLFNEQEQRATRLINEIDINSLTPLEALQKLDQLKKNLSQ